MSQINVLGPVGFNSTGNYDNTKQYEKLDVVYYEGSSYVAVQSSIGQLPTNTTYWDKIAGKGDTGNGISSITKTATSGLVDIYTITFTNGQTTTFEVTNGSDGSVTDVQVDGTSVVNNGVANIEGLTEMAQELADALQELEDMYNLLPKVQGTGAIVPLSNTAVGKMIIGLGGNTTTISGDTVGVSGNNKIVIEFKNLFDKNSVGWVRGYLTNSGAIYTSNTAKYCLATNAYIKVKPNTNYYWSYNLGSGVAHLNNVFVCEYDKDKTFIERKTHVHSLTTGNNTQYIRISWYLFYDENNTYVETNLSAIDNYITDVQLEYGTTGSTYTAYIKQNYSLNLGSIELNTGDSIQKISDTWKIVRSDTTVETITDDTLIGQLEALRKAKSYLNQTNVTQENSNSPFIMDVTALEQITQ